MIRSDSAANEVKAIGARNKFGPKTDGVGGLFELIPTRELELQLIDCVTFLGRNRPVIMGLLPLKQGNGGQKGRSVLGIIIGRRKDVLPGVGGGEDEVILDLIHHSVPTGKGIDVMGVAISGLRVSSERILDRIVPMGLLFGEERTILIEEGDGKDIGTIPPGIQGDVVGDRIAVEHPSVAVVVVPTEEIVVFPGRILRFGGLFVFLDLLGEGKSIVPKIKGNSIGGRFDGA